jgi:hypothetical protein
MISCVLALRSIADFLSSRTAAGDKASPCRQVTPSTAVRAAVPIRVFCVLDSFLAFHGPCPRGDDRL